MPGTVPATEHMAVYETATITALVNLHDTMVTQTIYKMERQWQPGEIICKLYDKRESICNKQELIQIDK